MTPRLPPRASSFSLPLPTIPSPVPRHLPLLSLRLSLGVLLVVFPPLLTFPLRPRVPHSLLLLPSRSPVLFFSLTLFLFLAFFFVANGEGKRDATRRRVSRFPTEVFRMYPRAIESRTWQRFSSDRLDDVWLRSLSLFLSLSRSFYLSSSSRARLRVFLQRVAYESVRAKFATRWRRASSSLLQLAYARLVFLSRVLSLFLSRRSLS